MRLGWLCVAGCAALIAGCSQKAADNGAASANAAAAAPTANAAATQAAATGPETGPSQILPSPKAGLWKRVSVQDGAAPDNSSKCLTGAPIDPMEGFPGKCASMVNRVTGAGFTVDADCPNNGMDAKLHMTGAGDFDKSFTTDADMTMTGGPGPAMTTHNHSVWTYAGACPAGGVATG